MRCEMCGREAELSDAIVEGVLLGVCNDCARYGDVIKIKDPTRVNMEKKQRKDNVPEIMEEIVDDYDKKVKDARERFGLKQEEVALKIAEKESMIQAIESGKLRPSLDVARKLEKFFNIRLIEEYREEKKVKQINFRDKSLTIGDLIKDRK